MVICMDFPSWHAYETGKKIIFIQVNWSMNPLTGWWDILFLNRTRTWHSHYKVSYIPLHPVPLMRYPGFQTELEHTAPQTELHTPTPSTHPPSLPLPPNMKTKVSGVKKTQSKHYNIADNTLGNVSHWACRKSQHVTINIYLQNEE